MPTWAIWGRTDPLGLVWSGPAHAAPQLCGAGGRGCRWFGRRGCESVLRLVSGLLRVPLVFLATVATIIASQSIISGAFSMTRQAIQLGLCPRLHITQTSAEGYGQIYVGFVNWVLMALTLGLTLAFRSSDNLAAAFGVAVSLTMLLTSVLIYRAMREIWHWSLPLSRRSRASSSIVDLSFVSANLMKVFEGGFVPLVIAACDLFCIWTWRDGRSSCCSKLERDTLPLSDFIVQIHDKPRVPGQPFI